MVWRQTRYSIWNGNLTTLRTSRCSLRCCPAQRVPLYLKNIVMEWVSTIWNKQFSQHTLIESAVKMGPFFLILKIFFKKRSGNDCIFASCTKMQKKTTVICLFTQNFFKSTVRTSDWIHQFWFYLRMIKKSNWQNY